MGYKKIEAAAEDKLGANYLACAKKDGANCDAIVSSCAYQTKDYKKNFWLNEKTEILEVGQPRCDALLSADEACIKEQVRQRLKIAKEKSIVLYAPTFRDGKNVSCFALDFEGIVATLKQTTNNDYVIVVRLHPNVQHLCSFLQYNDHIINGSTYPDIQELLVASDILITDYSSAAFDFALLDKPVFLCMLDYEDYLNLRGLSDTFESCPFSKAYSNAEMIQVLERFSLDEYQERLHHYKQTFWKPFEDGHSAERVVNWLKKII
jgi:CDP-glycerol glycerophosphotransferase